MPTTDQPTASDREADLQRICEEVGLPSPLSAVPEDPGLIEDYAKEVARRYAATVGAGLREWALNRDMECREEAERCARQKRFGKADAMLERAASYREIANLPEADFPVLGAPPLGLVPEDVRKTMLRIRPFVALQAAAQSGRHGDADAARALAEIDALIAPPSPEPSPSEQE